MKPVLQHREWLIQPDALQTISDSFQEQADRGGFPARAGRVDAASRIPRSRPDRRHHVAGEHGEEDAGEVIELDLHGALRTLAMNHFKKPIYLWVMLIYANMTALIASNRPI